MHAFHWRACAAAISFITFSAALGADATSGVSEVDAALNATCLNNLAAVYSTEGKYAVAEGHYRKALELWRQKPGNETSVTLALNNLGVLLRRQARYSEAEAVDLQALKTFEELLG